MSRPVLPLLLVLATTAVPTRAASPAPLAAEPAPAKAAAAPAPPHRLSPGTSAKLAAGLPKFLVRPAEPAPANQDVTEPVDLREIDRPRNTIVRLPRALLPPPPDSRRSATLSATDDAPPDGVTRLPNYEVRDRKYPALKNRELLTPEGKIELQFKKHPGLHIGNLFGLNRGIAAGMAAEEDAYERRLEMADLVDFQRFVGTLPPARSTDSDDAGEPPAPAPAPASTGK